MSKRFSRSQSALEYMMTYGWAILIIVIVAAVLYGMGIFNPYASISQTITGFEPFIGLGQGCGNGATLVRIANPSQYPVEILNATIISANGFTASSTGFINYTMGVQQKHTLTFYNSTCNNPGSFYSANVIVWYSYTDGALGTITTKTTGYISGKASLQQTVTFQEVGLPLGTNWFMNYGGGVKSSSSQQISFILFNNTQFLPGNVSINRVDYFPSAFSGTVANKSLFYIDYIPVRDIFVAAQGSKTAIVINPISDAVTTTIPISTNPQGLSVTPNGELVYIMPHGNANISVINTSLNEVVANVTTGTNPAGIAINYEGTIVYALSAGGGGVLQSINATTFTTIGTAKIGGTPLSVAITPDDKYLYITQSGTNTVLVADAHTLAPILSIPVGSTPQAIAISPDGEAAYVANYASNTVSVISVKTNTVIKTIPVGTSPEGIAVSPGGNTVLVTNYGSNTMSVIATSNLSVTRTVNVGSGPTGIVILPNNEKIYVANQLSNSVSVLYTGNYSIKTNITGIATPVGIADSGSSST